MGEEANSVFRAIGQWGLPMVATVFLAWVVYQIWKYYEAKLKTKEDEHSKERKELQAEIKDLNEALVARLEASNQVNAGNLNKVNEIVAQLAVRERELREEKKDLERELRSTGSHDRHRIPTPPTGMDR